MSTWKKYGGLSHVEAQNSISAYSLSVDLFTLRQAYFGTFDICGELHVSGNALVDNDVRSNNVTVQNDISCNQFFVKSTSNHLGNMNVTGNLSVLNGNVRIMNGNIDLSNNMYLSKKLFLGNSGLYLNGSDISGNIGINTVNPKSALDFQSTKSFLLNVETTNATNYSVLSKTGGGDGAILYADASVARLDFFVDGSANIGTTPDARLAYTSGGNFTIDVSSNTSILSNVSISNRSNQTVAHLYGETAVIYDNSAGTYQYPVYQKSTSVSGNALTLVANDASSVTFVNVVTSDKKGIALGGGAYPNDQTRAMGTIGLLDTSGTYCPAIHLVDASSNVYRKFAIGINTYAPELDNYVLNINGSTHMKNGQLTITTQANIEIYKMSLASTNSSYGIAIGSPYTTDLSFNDATYKYRQKVYYTTNRGETWNDSSTDINNGLTNTSIEQAVSGVPRYINDVFVYDASLAFLCANGIINYSNSSGERWYGISNVSGLRNYSSIYATGSRVFAADTSGNVLYFDYTNAIYTDFNGIPAISPQTLSVGYTGTPYLHGYGTQLFLAAGNNIYQLNNISGVVSSTLKFTNTYGAYRSLYTLDASNTIAVGSSVITWTNNGFSTRTDINVPGVTFNGVSIIDASNAIAVGNGGLVKYTTDGYATWNTVSPAILNSSGNGNVLADPLYNLTNVKFLDINQFYITKTVSAYVSATTFGNTSLFHCYVPELFNNGNNNVLDVSGATRLSGDININDGGRIRTNNSTFYLLDTCANVIRMGGEAANIFIGNSVSSITTVNSSLVTKQDASFNGNVVIGGNTVSKNYMFSSYYDSANADGSIYIGGLNNSQLGLPVNPGTRNIKVGNFNTVVDMSCNIYVGGASDAVIIGGSVYNNSSLNIGPQIFINYLAISNSSPSCGMYIGESGSKYAGYILISKDMGGFIMKSTKSPNVIKLDVSNLIYNGSGSYNQGLVTLSKLTQGINVDASYSIGVGTIDLSNVFLKNWALSSVASNLQTVDTSMSILGNLAIGKSSFITGTTVDISGNVLVSSRLGVGNTAVNGSYVLDVLGSTNLGGTANITGLVTALGNMGINRSSVTAGYALDVSGNTKVSGNLMVANGFTLNGGGIIATAAQTITFGTNSPIMDGSNITNIPVASITGLSTALAGINSSGNVGINKSSASTGYVLDISGSVSINKPQLLNLRMYNKSATFDYAAAGFTLVGTSTMFLDGTRGYVFSFNGATYYRLSTSPVNTPTTTMAFWVYYTGQSSQNIINTTWWPNYYNASGRFTSNVYYTGGGPVLTESTTKTTNSWHHYAITISSTFATLYVDGVLDASASFSSSYNGWSRVSPSNGGYTNYGFVVGSKGTVASLSLVDGSFNGYLDDVRVYNNIALTASQVSDLYLNGGNITYALDISGNTNIGGNLVVSNGISATSTQTIDFGTNAPIMRGNNIVNGTVPDAALTSNIPRLNATQTFTATNTFTTLQTFNTPSSDSINVRNYIQPGGHLYVNQISQIGYWNGIGNNWYITYFGDIYTTGNIEASTASRTIDFGTNAPIMRGNNIASGTIPVASINGLSNAIPGINSTGSVGINKSSATAGYALDVSGNTSVSGNLTTIGGISATAAQTINFGTNAPTMRGNNIANGTIPDAALTSNIPRLNATQTFTAVQSFNIPSGDAISVSNKTIGQTSGYLYLNNTSQIGYWNGSSQNWYITYVGDIYTTGNIDASTASRTINFGTNAPTMRGNNIATGTIPVAAINGLSTALVGINSTGNVGINKSSATAGYALDVSGNTYVSQGLWAEGSALFGSIPTYISLVITPTGSNYAVSESNIFGFGSLGTINISKTSTVLSTPSGSIGASTFSYIPFPYAGDYTFTYSYNYTSTVNVNMYIYPNSTSGGNGTQYLLGSINGTSGTISTSIYLSSGLTGGIFSAAFGGGRSTSSTSSTLTIKFQPTASAYISSNLGLGNGLTLTSGGISATAAQTITFGTNAPTMYGNNIATGTIPVAAINGLSTSTAGINSTGNVAINKSTPTTAAQLDVNGNLIVSSAIFQTSTSHGINFGVSNTSNNVYSKIYDNGNLHIWTDDIMYVDIGGTTPSNTTIFPASYTNVAAITSSNFGINTNSYVSGNLGVRKTSVTVGYALDVSGNTNVSGNIVVAGGISATASQTINFGTNAPTMYGNNIANGTIPDAALTSNIPRLNATQTFTALQTFNTPYDSINVRNNTVGQTNGYFYANQTSNIGYYTGAGNNWVISYTGDMTTLGNVAIRKSTFATAGYALDVNGNTYVGGNLTVNNGFTVSAGTVSFPAGSISSSAISGGVNVVGINSTGNVAINKTTPASNTQLDISGNLMVSGIFQSTVNNNGINFGPSNPGGTIYSKIYDNSNLHIWTYDGLYFDIGGGPPGNITGTPSGVNVALITLTNFGINTNSYVSGNLGVGKISVTAGYALDVNGNVLATSYNASSDARLKTHIQPLVSTFDTIQKINAVSFDWKGNGKSDCGFIAQNVFEHLPNMRPDNWSIDIEEPVDASGNPIYYSIDYSKMTPHLWGAVHDLVKDNRRLNQENASLKKRIERIEAALGL